MSEPIIKVENLSKSYILKHQNAERYTALRDVLTNKVKFMFKHSVSNSPFGGHGAELFWALNDISFEVNQGDRIGIIGRNGAGKSTLLKILSRIVSPTKGKITIDGRIASLLEVGTGFHPELTGRENIFLNGSILGMSKTEIKTKFDEIVDFSGVEKFLDTPVKRYSSGMYVRLAFAVAAHLEPEILIVDEVLAVGDADFQKKCLGKMQDVSNSGRTILFVSHNMAAVTQLCNRGLLLDKGTVEKDGAIQDVILTYQNAGSKTNSSLDDIKNRGGSGLCRLTDFKILNQSNLEKEVFQLGEKIKFKLTFKNASGLAIDKMRIIIGVYNSFNEGYLRFDSNNSNKNFQSNQQSFEVICNVDEHLNIKPDLYFINVALYQDTNMLDYVAGVATFNIDNFDYFETGRDIENAELAKVYYKHTWQASN